MKVVWTLPPLSIWLPVVIVFGLLCVLGLACLIWRKCILSKKYAVCIAKDPSEECDKSIDMKETVVSTNYVPYTVSPPQEDSTAQGSRSVIRTLRLEQMANKENVINQSKENVENPIAGVPAKDGEDSDENFILDHSVLNFGEKRFFERTDDGLPPEIAQKLNKILQGRINAAAKIVRERLNLSLPEGATDKQKEEKRRIFHKMVWIVAKDEKLKL